MCSSILSQCKWNQDICKLVVERTLGRLVDGMSNVTSRPSQRLEHDSIFLARRSSRSLGKQRVHGASYCFAQYKMFVHITSLSCLLGDKVANARKPFNNATSTSRPDICVAAACITSADFVMHTITHGYISLIPRLHNYQHHHIVHISIISYIRTIDRSEGSAGCPRSIILGQGKGSSLLLCYSRRRVRRSGPGLRVSASAAESPRLGLLIECDGVLVDTHMDGHRVAFNRAFGVKLVTLLSHVQQSFWGKTCHTYVTRSTELLGSTCIRLHTFNRPFGIKLITRLGGRLGRSTSLESWAGTCQV